MNPVPQISHNVGYDGQIKQLLSQIMDRGEYRQNRTGVATKAMFGGQLAIDLADGFPLTTLRKIHIRSVVHELLWFLRGDTNIAYLHANKVTMWDEWADANGDLGPIYGEQFRRWKGADGRTHDQVANVLHLLRSDPQSRRMMINLWNVGCLDKMALTPCHCTYNLSSIGGRLSCHLYQRSQDQIALSFNASTAALLTTIFAQLVGMEPGYFIHSWGDVHIYENHFDAVHTMLDREPRPLPKLTLNPDVKNIDDFCFEDFVFSGYDPHPNIAMPIAV